MPDATYQLIIEGKIKPDHDRKAVLQQMMTFLKTDEKGIQKLFAGGPRVIKKGMDFATAQKIQKKVEAIGAVCRTETESPPPPPLISKPAAGPADPSEMVACPSCNYRQRKSPKCIMCGTSLSGANAAPEKSAHPPLRRQTSPASEAMVLTNLNYVPGRDIIEHFGLVSGNTIRAKHIGKDILASLKNLIGGELKGYTQLLTESREQAVQRMVEQARQLGANAVVNVRFSTSSVAQGAAELYAYGTAVRVE